MTYDFRRLEELGWVAIVAAGMFVLTVAIQFDPDKITSWQTWAISLSAGCVRAAAGAILAAISKPR